MHYEIVYGLAPYFRQKLLSIVNSCPEFVICFDEAFNEVLQKGQLDVLLRFWNPVDNIVESRYLGSEFMGHAKAVDIVRAVRVALRDLDIGKLLQISMDGPNVNLKFFEDFCSDIEAEGLSVPLNIGSCSLHVIHGALLYGNGVTGWKLDKFLKNLYYFFKDTAVRRADFVELTGGYNIIE